MKSFFVRSFAALGVSLGLLSGAAHAAPAKPVVVASKIDTEGAVLGNMIALLLENAGIEVTRKIQPGPTKIVRTALLAGEIDIYPEYTGNAGFFLSMDADPLWKDANTAYEKARALDAPNNLVWLKPAPADNTWGIAVRGDVKLAGSAEFVESPAALPAFQQAYGFKLTGDQLLVLSGGDTTATIKAAAEGTSGVNSAMVYGTDGAIAALNMKVMQDTKHVQPVYQPAPVVRAGVLTDYPQIPEILAPAFAGLTLEVLQELNAKVQLEGQDAKSVAQGYLKGKNLLK